MGIGKGLLTNHNHEANPSLSHHHTPSATQKSVAKLGLDKSQKFHGAKVHVGKIDFVFNWFKRILCVVKGRHPY